MSVPEIAEPVAAGPDLYATILLAGPGGAGKTTIGRLLAGRLGVPFVDLDAQFTARYGDISPWLDRHGYAAYAACNVQLFIDLVAPPVQTTVIALSSGFLTYPADVHPAYHAGRRAIATHRSTVVLLPSLTGTSASPRPCAGRFSDRSAEAVHARRK
jgi:shikimate kinase